MVFAPVRGRHDPQLRTLGINQAYFPCPDPLVYAEAFLLHVSMEAFLYSLSPRLARRCRTLI